MYIVSRLSSAARFFTSKLIISQGGPQETADGGNRIMLHNVYGSTVVSGTRNMGRQLAVGISLTAVSVRDKLTDPAQWTGLMTPAMISV